LLLGCPAPVRLRQGHQERNPQAALCARRPEGGHHRIAPAPSSRFQLPALPSCRHDSRRFMTKTQETTMTMTRRTVLNAAAAATLAAPWIHARAAKAEFTYKYANNLPVTHPMNIRAKEMSAAILAETNGRVDIQIF